MARKKLRTLFIDVNQLERLARLSAITRVPQAVYMRDGIDYILKKHEKKLKIGNKK